MSGEHPADPLSLPSVAWLMFDLGRSSGQGTKAHSLFARSRHPTVDPGSPVDHPESGTRAAPYGFGAIRGGSPSRPARKPICFPRAARHFDFASPRRPAAQKAAPSIETRRVILEHSEKVSTLHGRSNTTERAEAQRVAMTARNDRGLSKTYDVAGGPAGDNRLRRFPLPETR